MYSWIPFFTELAKKLLSYEDRQPELIAILKDAGVKAGLMDRDSKGDVFPLDVIDPLTFVSQITKYRSAKRLPLVKALREKLNIEAALPDDFDGIPGAYPLASWFFEYAAKREPLVIPLLWKFSRQVVSGSVTADLFEQTLALKQIGLPKLTQAMFCLNPDRYLPIDKQTQPYLKASGIATDFNDRNRSPLPV